MSNTRMIKLEHTLDLLSQKVLTVEEQIFDQSLSFLQKVENPVTPKISEKIHRQAENKYK